MIKITFDNVQIGNPIIFAFGSEIHMKLDIPYYIRQVLREQRMVYIPSIGTFRLNQSSASFNDDKTKITPPSLDISFDDSESNDESLLKYILDAGLLNEDKAKKKIDQYTQSAFNKLLNVDAFLIDGVGTIAKRVENDIVEFEPRVSQLTREFNDLIPLKLTPISRIAEQNPIMNAGIIPPKVEESGSFLPRILLLTLFLIGTWFVGKHLYNTYFSQSDDTEIGVDENEAESDAAAILDSNEKELQQKYEEIDELIDPLNEKEKEKIEIKTPVENNTFDAEPEQIKEEVVENVEVAKEEVNEPDKTEDDPIDEGNSKSIEQQTQDSDKPLNKYADIIPETGECIIVVGSFIKSLNTIKMVSLLERRGYKVYQSEYKGFTRVGIKYECIDEDLEAYLHTIRKKISKRAWYLDPTLDVPYQK